MIPRKLGSVMRQMPVDLVRCSKNGVGGGRRVCIALPLSNNYLLLHPLQTRTRLHSFLYILYNIDDISRRELVPYAVLRCFAAVDFSTISRTGKQVDIANLPS